MSKKPTTLGTKISIISVVLFGIMLANVDWDTAKTPQGDWPEVRIVKAIPVPRKTTMAPVMAPVKTVEKPLSKWVRPRIYPGVKLYYSYEGTKMQYIGTISDAVGGKMNGERTFGITMASGSTEYKYRKILWNGQWFMNREQGQRVIDEFTAR